MKKITYIITLIFFSIFLTGCVDVKINEEVTVNADKSIDHSISLLASDDVSFAEDCIKEKFTEILKDKGFGNFVEQNEFDFFGMKGSTHIDMDKENSYPDGILKTNISNKYIHLSDNSTDYFLFKYYDLTVSIDIDAMHKDVQNDLLNLLEYRYTLNLPVKIRNSNANNVYNDDKSATWILAKNSKNSLHVEFIIINIEHLIIISSILIILLLLLTLRMHIISKKKNNKRIKIQTNKQCPNCKSIVNISDDFCTKCGTKLIK